MGTHFFARAQRLDSVYSLRKLGRACLLVAVPLLGACSGAEREHPDVLLVTLDTTRADRLSCYGYETETSPELDALAAEGGAGAWIGGRSVCGDASGSISTETLAR